MNRKLLKLR